MKQRNTETTKHRNEAPKHHVGPHHTLNTNWQRLVLRLNIVFGLIRPKKLLLLISVFSWVLISSVRFFKKIQDRIFYPRSYGFVTTKESKNPKIDFIWAEMVNTKTEEGLKYSRSHHLKGKDVLKRLHRCHYSRTDTPINASSIVLLIEIRDT